jgi:formylmethanofuran dehydrogenase subunit B
MKQTACPMDCFDACTVEYIDGKCKPGHDMVTNGKLCRLFGYLQSEKKLVDKNLNKTLEKTAKVLETPDQKVLYYKGVGNLGVMQSIPKLFFEKIKATFATGGLCLGAGVAGIEMSGRSNVNPPIEELLNSEVIIVWGRNLTQTSKHIYELIKNKKFITIDPVRTEIAELSEVFLQIPPKGDFLLAKLLQNALDLKKIDSSLLKKLGISKADFEKVIELISNKKVSVMLGLGAQKYKEGAEIFHEIDKVCEKLGLLGGINSGVWYLGNGSYAYENKIQVTPTNICSYPDVKFDDYDVVFIQGANPVVSAPDTEKIKKELQNTFVIYMGICENDTSEFANIIIPAKTFLQKKDVRLSYGHDGVNFLEICEENPHAVSEYELTKYLFDTFGFQGLLEEDEYLDVHKGKRKEKPSFKFIAKNNKDVELIDLQSDDFYLITSKSTKSLNSQFKYDEYAYVHPSLGFENEQMVTISSFVNKIQIKVKNDHSVLKNSILFYAGNKSVNKLIPNSVSNYGNNACLQDVKVTICKKNI